MIVVADTSPEPHRANRGFAVNAKIEPAPTEE
jgi:hypothetical protein